jgi:hypothetical protein
MEKEMLGNMFRYEDGKLYKKHKSSKNIWRCLTDYKPTNKGYIRCKVNDRSYFVHRLVYLFYNPNWNIYDYSANNSIDHMNGNKLDNRIENLKCVNHSQNNQNKTHRNCKEIKGYYFRKDGKNKPWIARWNENCKQKLKAFKTQKEAKEHYEKMVELHYYRPCKNLPLS